MYFVSPWIGPCLTEINCAQANDHEVKSDEDCGVVFWLETGHTTFDWSGFAGIIKDSGPNGVFREREVWVSNCFSACYDLLSGLSKTVVRSGAKVSIDDA